MDCKVCDDPVVEDGGTTHDECYEYVRDLWLAHVAGCECDECLLYVDLVLGELVKPGHDWKCEACDKPVGIEAVTEAGTSCNSSTCMDKVFW